ncbi:LOW QUALITY PROTEIN: cytidine and dCMP deaminase domain-containing protein 1-like [Dendronephthya gigantea]|uniref:LOW QUALITY PROTEIN: cytidine and dCMP deaminase domain-containing protein 1-like n=1 Tax=Dendronephthya gigantea TaxID=151771 RepID=UPI00106D0FAF|nr:LOW QUALITY PROTEIN: cytidine and dCMP deaminase domain-containing protein 1-like [Dendronephthya gigantea]
MSSSPERKRPKRSTDISDDKTSALYAKSYKRVTKDDLYMIIALWMQDIAKLPGVNKRSNTLRSDADKPRYHNVGAVLVLPNDVIFAADCSRDGAHAVARLLMQHSDKAEGCKIFVSRKPCPLCAKLLVQSKVKRVLYLPSEPEYYPLDKADKVKAELDKAKAGADKAKAGADKADDDERKAAPVNRMSQVDNMFTASAIAQTIFVFQVESGVLTDASSRKNPGRVNEVKEIIEGKKKEFVRRYGFEGNPGWKEVMKEELPWPAFNSDIDSQVQKYFNNAMEWMAQTMVLSGKGLDYDFKLSGPSVPRKSKTIFDPVDPDQARRFIVIARFLAERTDDPKTGVGAVIVSPKMDVLAFGWNGFPFKAYYSEFARASDDDDPTLDKKYPYVIHAEQNAILMRNSKSVEGAILFVTKTPCDECAPLIAMAGIKTVVVDEGERKKKNHEKKELSYTMFRDMVKDSTFVCYETRKQNNPEDANISKARKRLSVKMEQSLD